jgi:hypothetical protein
MKNIIKATKMQSAKKQPVKAQITRVVTKKASRELDQLSE